MDTFITILPGILILSAIICVVVSANEARNAIIRIQKHKPAEESVRAAVVYMGFTVVLSTLSLLFFALQVVIVND